MRNAVQTPNETHATAAKICEMAFQAMGLEAKRAVDYRDGYDFLVANNIRVACRYAMPSSDRKQVYRKRDGELSTYTYKRWTFNFHRHGRITERYCDFFVCFLVTPDEKKGGVSDISVFVIPWEAITGLTFCSSIRDESSRGYRGKYAVYRDAWHLIEQAARGKTTSEKPRKRLKISADKRRRLRMILQGENDRPELTALLPDFVRRSTQTTGATGKSARLRSTKPGRISRRVVPLRAE